MDKYTFKEVTNGWILTYTLKDEIGTSVHSSLDEVLESIKNIDHQMYFDDRGGLTRQQFEKELKEIWVG